MPVLAAARLKNNSTYSRNLGSYFKLASITAAENCAYYDWTSALKLNLTKLGQIYNTLV